MPYNRRHTDVGLYEMYCRTFSERPDRLAGRSVNPSSDLYAFLLELKADNYFQQPTGQLLTAVNCHQSFPIRLDLTMSKERIIRIPVDFTIPSR